jgi:hypothetical protein
MSLAWFPGFRGVDQIEIEHPDPHLVLPHRCPALVGSTNHPVVSANWSAASTSFFGWRRRIPTIMGVNADTSCVRMLTDVNTCAPLVDSDSASWPWVRSSLVTW